MNMDQAEMEDHCENSAFANLYKNTDKINQLSQNQRRQKFLEEHRKKRHAVVDKHRELCGIEIGEHNIEHEEMECEFVQHDSRKKKINYKFMKSEWLIEIPDDLEEKWLVKFCPQGFRVLLVAQNCRTIISVNDRVILNIQSNIPGGGFDGPSAVTVLDCIYNRYTRTIFILDCLIWNSMSMLDCETSFRFFWLQTKFNENPHLKFYRKFSFSLLEHYPAHRSVIEDKMLTPLSFGENSYPIDGVVFYHEESTYTFGSTPLVGWLASFMLPEKLHINVCLENMVKKPDDYSCMELYLQNLNKKKSHSSRSKKKTSSNQQKSDSEMEIQQ